MRQYPVFDTASQNEALINEFKGNLFEYLVGLQLAKHAQVEADFLKSVEPHLLERLRAYEDWLWGHDEQLAMELPVLATRACEELLNKLPVNLKRVIVIGKLAGGSHDDTYGEADLLIFDRNEKIIPISLKLCRRGAYVNTKSAGVRSFLSKYFATIPAITLLQERVNYVLDESFTELAQAFHQRHGLEESDRFAAAWENAGLPQLPGDLVDDDQLQLQQHYGKVIGVIYEGFSKALKENHKAMVQSFLTLLGFHNPDLVQLTCYYSNDKQGRYQLDRLHFMNLETRLKQFAAIEVVPPKDQQASFSMQFDGGTFQIRVKPMNKFTQPALKINCSVREDFN